MDINQIIRFRNKPPKHHNKQTKQQLLMTSSVVILSLLSQIAVPITLFP